MVGLSRTPGVVDVSISYSYRLTAPLSRDLSENSAIKDLLTGLRGTTGASIELTQLGLDFRFSAGVTVIDPKSIRWLVADALAPARSILTSIAAPTATILAVRLDDAAAGLMHDAAAIASWLAPGLVLLTCWRPDQQLRLETAASEVTLTMPYQPDLEYLALLAPAVIGIIATFALGEPAPGRLSFDGFTSAIEEEGILIAAGSSNPLATGGRTTVLKAKDGDTETDVLAQRTLMTIFSVSEPRIAALLEGPDLNELRDRLMGAAQLPVDSWTAPSSSAPLATASGPVYSYNAPAGMYRYGYSAMPAAGFYGYGPWRGAPYRAYGDAPLSGPPAGLYGYGSRKSLTQTLPEAQTTTGRPTEQGASKVRTGVRLGQIVSAGLVAIVLTTYLVAVIEGWVPSPRKLGLTELGILVVGLALMALLIYPSLLDRISRVSLGGVDFELTRLQRNQDAQREELRRHRFVLLLLLGESERTHLRELQGNTQVWYSGNPVLRNELRRLRHLGLVRNRGEHVVHELSDGKVSDITEFVELTDAGIRYLNEIKEDADPT